MPGRLKLNDRLLLAGLQRSRYRHDVESSWVLYKRLLRRQQTGTHTKPLSAVPLVASRQQLNCTLMNPSQPHSEILRALNPKHMHGYNDRDKERTLFRIRRVLGYLTGSGSSRVEMSSGDLNQLLESLTRLQQWEALDQIWQYTALSQGLVRDVTNYNMYLNGLMEAGRYEEAMRVLREIRQGGLRPTAYTYMCVIKLYGLMGDLEAARRMYRQICEGKPGQETGGLFGRARRETYMEDIPFDVPVGYRHPNIHVHNAMLEVLGMNGLVDEMRELFLEQAVGIASVGWYRPGQDLWEAVSRFREEEGLRHRTKPNQTTFHTMIKWMAEYWHLDTAYQYIRVMHRLYGMAPGPQTLKLLINKKTVQQDVRQCADLALTIAVHHGVEAPRYVVNLLKWQTKRQKRMEAKVREAEQQRSLIFGGLK